MNKANKLRYVLQAFRDMGANEWEVVEEAIACAKAPCYLGDWYTFLTGGTH